jgi:hypothetical protein
MVAVARTVAVVFKGGRLFGSFLSALSHLMEVPLNIVSFSLMLSH